MEEGEDLVDNKYKVKEFSIFFGTIWLIKSFSRLRYRESGEDNGWFTATTLNLIGDVKGSTPPKLI